jgi:hypothetical protein
VEAFSHAGPVALAKRRAEGKDPAHTPEARKKQGARASENMRLKKEWELLQFDPTAALDFKNDILPNLRGLPLSAIMNATGLSLRYCSLIRRGIKIPHRRHWSALLRLDLRSS